MRTEHQEESSPQEVTTRLRILRPNDLALAGMSHMEGLHLQDAYLDNGL